MSKRFAAAGSVTYRTELPWRTFRPRVVAKNYLIPFIFFLHQM
jgi:hypothetical protein